MILPYYQETYNKFIQEYEKLHVNPWHEINKENLNEIYTNLINQMEINDDYTFIYLIKYIIKKLSGKTDAHTALRLEYKQNFLPIYFRIIENQVISIYPEKNTLKSINNVPIGKILKELEEITAYGTNGKKIYELEKALFNKAILLSIPSLRGSQNLTFQMTNKDITFEKNEIPFDFAKYCFGGNATYQIIDNCLIYNHKSVQPIFENQIINAYQELTKLDITNIDTIIIDLRGNFGGNASLNKYIINFIEQNPDKKLYVLTDYRIFSAGRYALTNLINLNAITIGEEIATPINCYGNSYNETINGFTFSISTRYLNPLIKPIKTKEEFLQIDKEMLKPIIFHPDIFVTETLEDFLTGKDLILEKALELSKTKTIIQ